MILLGTHKNILILFGVRRKLSIFTNIIINTYNHKHEYNKINTVIIKIIMNPAWIVSTYQCSHKIWWWFFFFNGGRSSIGYKQTYTRSHKNHNVALFPSLISSSHSLEYFLHPLQRPQAGKLGIVLVFPRPLSFSAHIPSQDHPWLGNPRGQFPWRKKVN